MSIVICTGGFDPLHSGHVKYLNSAKKLGDNLVIGLNSDEWLARKKGQAFMPWSERATILENLHMTGEVIAFDDTDDTARDAIRVVQEKFKGTSIIFANGGDRTATNIPEMVFHDVEFVFGVGGEDKSNSSSWLLEEWKAPKTMRQWGYYRVLHEVTGTKVKELVVMPGRSLSMQRHHHRAEYWFVSEGEATVWWDNHGSSKINRHSNVMIQNREWHRLCNDTDVLLKVIEIQYGESCDETDIERTI